MNGSTTCLELPHTAVLLFVGPKRRPIRISESPILLHLNHKKMRHRGHHASFLTIGSGTVSAFSLPQSVNAEYESLSYNHASLACGVIVRQWKKKKRTKKNQSLKQSVQKANKRKLRPKTKVAFVDAPKRHFHKGGTKRMGRVTSGGLASLPLKNLLPQDESKILGDKRSSRGVIVLSGRTKSVRRDQGV